MMTTQVLALNVLATAGVSRMFAMIFWAVMLLVFLAAVGAALRGRRSKRQEFGRRMEEGRQEVLHRRGLADRWGFRR